MTATRSVSRTAFPDWVKKYATAAVAATERSAAAATHKRLLPAFGGAKPLRAGLVVRGVVGADSSVALAARRSRATQRLIVYQKHGEA